MHFLIEEASIMQMQAAMEAGILTSKQLVLKYLDRIAKYDKEGPSINSVIEINPEAIFIAEALDREREVQGPRGPLHGIPLLLKDNIDTGDKMHTSAGSMALADSYASEDAFLAGKLREAGAVFLGKANMTEFANFMTRGMPSGYSSRGGQTVNPYAVSATPGGSSSGSAVAVAANFCAAAVGTETSGSILNPSNQNAVVGIKPTVGLISRTGIIPISFSQDTAGPIARNVTDAALLLGVMTGIDSRDPATARGRGLTYSDYMQFLDVNGLNGARIGVARDTYFDSLTDEQRKLATRAIEKMESLGAVIVDPANIPTAHEIQYSSVLVNEFKSAINAYLSTLGPGAPMRTLKQIIEFNNAYPKETLKYGQTTLLQAEFETSGTMTEPAYVRDRLNDLLLCQSKGIDAVMDQYQLDAIVFPRDEGECIAARAGYPSVIVPAGYTGDGVPFGITFTAKAFSEPLLIKLAYCFEQATKHRIPPAL